uniref:Uncharacterized protein n=1 Tax=Meloidogyne enterolobii TaxID=390850 RepID=A0A6V7V8Q4_MELEN|nr:unnamed protein product [Meloidogyne enterolobii]
MNKENDLIILFNYKARKKNSGILPFLRKLTITTFKSITSMTTRIVFLQARFTFFCIIRTKRSVTTIHPIFCYIALSTLINTIVRSTK